MVAMAIVTGGRGEHAFFDTLGMHPANVARVCVGAFQPALFAHGDLRVAVGTGVREIERVHHRERVSCRTDVVRTVAGAAGRGERIVRTHRGDFTVTALLKLRLRVFVTRPAGRGFEFLRVREVLESGEVGVAIGTGKAGVRRIFQRGVSDDE